jgi:hypothetical protein
VFIEIFRRKWSAMRTTPGRLTARERVTNHGDCCGGCDLFERICDEIRDLERGRQRDDASERREMLNVEMFDKESDGSE